MDVEITTTDPGEVSAEEIYRALTDAGYYVDHVAVLDRMNMVHTEYRDGQDSGE